MTISRASFPSGLANCGWPDDSGIKYRLRCIRGADVRRARSGLL